MVSNGIDKTSTGLNLEVITSKACVEFYFWVQTTQEIKKVLEYEEFVEQQAKQLTKEELEENIKRRKLNSEHFGILDPELSSYIKTAQAKEASS